MALINNLKKIVDQPVWEWSRFSPVAASALSAMASSDDTMDRYIYYVHTSSLYRYDTVTDSWMQLASPPVAAVTLVTLRYSKYSGNRGRVLGSSSVNTVKIPYVGNSHLIGKKIRIMGGTGFGQERTIIAVSDATIHDSCLATTAGANSITDSTKKWKINQWAGYNCRIRFNTGQSYMRKIIYNDATTLTFLDTNHQAIDPWNNTGFFTAPVATAGAQAHYVIESQVITVDENWTIQPNHTSRYSILSGGLWMLSSAAAAPFFSMQYYDIAGDYWVTKTATASMLTAALGTDASMDRTGEVGGAFETGTASSGSARVLNDTTKSLVPDRFVNYQIRIIGGTGAGQKRRIVANGTNYFEVNLKWETVPDATSQYVIYGHTDNIYLMGGGLSSLFKYHAEADLWCTGSMYDFGVANNMSVRFGDFVNIGVASVTRGTNGITSVNTTPTAGGSGYKIGDVLTVSGGTNGKVYVERISSTGAVLEISLQRCGTGYTVASGVATTGGTGTGCTIQVLTLGVIGLITTSINHMMNIGDPIKFYGATDAAYNTTYVILGCDALTLIEVEITAAANAAAAASQSTTLLVDAGATWDVNEHVGKLVCVQPPGAAGAAQWRRITSNTATTLTISSAITAPTSGTSRFLIQDISPFGRDHQFTIDGKSGKGIATGGSTTTIVDTTKNWDPGSWVGYNVRIYAGTGLGSELAITANTETTLTFAAQSFTPDITTRYAIMDTFGTATGGSTTTLVDSTKNWKVNQWAGKRVKYLAGTGQGVEIAITSNTANTLTFATTTAPDTTTSYAILSIPARGAGIEISWLFGLSDATKKGKYIIAARGGGSNSFDLYDITREEWNFTPFMSPQTESMTTGTMYSYDGEDRLYFTKDATGRIYYLDIVKMSLENSGTIPYGMGTATIGNRFEIIRTEDGLRFLYVMRHSGQEMWRSLIFW